MVYQLLSAASVLLGGLALATSAGPGDETPYVGQYSLDTGGGDAMSGVHLLLFKGGDYAIAYFGGMQQGTWKVLPSGELELSEWPADPVGFYVFGRHNAALGGQVQLKFKNFEESSAKVGFTAPNAGPLPMHPAFSVKANCYASSYSLKRPATEISALYLAAYQDERSKQASRMPVAKSVLYTFLLDKRYNDYLVVHNRVAGTPATRYLGRFTNKQLTLYDASGRHPRGDSYGERYPIGATDLKELPAYIASARAKVPDKLAYSESPEEKTITYYRLAGTSKPLENSTVRLLAPLFKTSYD